MEHGSCSTGSACKGKALVMLVLGVLFLLGTLGVWPEFTFLKYWPLFLIVMGLHKLFCPCYKEGDKGDKCCK